MNKESKEMKSLRIKIRRQEDTIKALHIELGNCESYLWNLNTVEECMSTGAVVLMLSGITFDTKFASFRCSSDVRDCTNSTRFDVKNGQ